MACFKVFRTLVPTMFLSAFLLTACGGDDDDGETIIEEKTPLQAFSDRVGQIVCNAYVDCGCMPETKLADCQAALSDTLPLAGGIALMALPGLGFNNDAAQLCLDDIETVFTACPVDAELDESFLPASCGALTESGIGVAFTFAYGLQQLDDYCSNDMECAPGLGCHQLTGTCETLVATGGDCRYLDCAAGNSCYYESSGSTNTYTCVADLAAGVQCEVLASDQCAAGLYCLEDYAEGLGHMYCETSLLPLNAECYNTTSDPQECATGLYCETWDSNTCKARLAGGAACETAHEEMCLSNDCVSDGLGTGTGYCEAATFCTSFSYGSQF